MALERTGPDPIGCYPLPGVVVVGDLRKQAYVFRDLAGDEKARRREHERAIFLEIRRRVIALARILDPRGTDDRHDRKRKGALADGVAGHFEYASIGGQFRELSAGVA